MYNQFFGEKKKISSPIFFFFPKETYSWDMRRPQLYCNRVSSFCQRRLVALQQSSHPLSVWASCVTGVTVMALNTNKSAMLVCHDPCIRPGACVSSFIYQFYSSTIPLFGLFMLAAVCPLEIAIHKPIYSVETVSLIRSTAHFLTVFPVFLQ